MYNIKNVEVGFFLEKKWQKLKKKIKTYDSFPSYFLIRFSSK